MNDLERRLRDLGEKARGDVNRPLAPRAADLRRIRRRRAVLSTTAVACVATIVAVGALAATGGERPAPLPPADAPTVGEPRGCRAIPFRPTYVPAGFETEPRLDSSQPGWIGVFESNRPASIQVTTPDYAFFQTRPAPIEVLGAAGTIGLIHEGYSVELHHRGCDYVLNGYGIKRSEMERFARGLVAERGAPPPVAAVPLIWPEDTEEAAQQGCAAAGERERTGPAVVTRFAMEVLDWDAPLYEAPTKRSEPWTVFPANRDLYGGDVDAGVRLWLTEIVPRCWSVSSLSRLPDRRPTGLGIEVRGRTVEVGYGPLGANSATIEVAYGGKTRTVEDVRELGFVRFRLGFDPETTGHVLVLLRDEEGRVFTVQGAALPAGDFGAG